MTEEIKLPETKIVATNKIIVDESNPNEMSKVNFEALKENIKKYGFLIPVITNKDYKIADGFHRWKAARELGLTKIPVIALDVDEVDRRILRQVMNKLSGKHDETKDAVDFQFILDNSESAENELLELLPEEDYEKLLKRLSDPKTFPEREFDENVKVAYKCPKCGYNW